MEKIFERLRESLSCYVWALSWSYAQIRQWRITPELLATDAAAFLLWKTCPLPPKPPSLLIHLFLLSFAVLISLPPVCPFLSIALPSLSPSPPYLSRPSAVSQSGECFKCVWSSWLITAFVPWFVNTEQLIVVWEPCAAGGPGILLCVCACTCLSACLTVLNTAQMGINTSSLSWAYV